MPRPKGSKNKKTALAIENVDEKIAEVEQEIRELGEALKAKKSQLKQLGKAKAEQAKLAAEKKAKEDKAAILNAIEKSGKSVEEILELLNRE